ncbi:hypothetical protein DWB68_13715 [Galactobacter valiniphilus]|uniref:DUF4352 domain-containing protein n=1 Tax=Galactobacter valiniphilus TaxID=2676122 RepID=A0A399JFJ1_9MICC|nr:hypothetical protein [Galactobacter valiniphilus]RII41256.1 hypothetical protein DWB68_13715 [Galactobacter valiniphilus]
METPSAPPPAVASSDPVTGGAVRTDAAGRPVKALGETALLSAPGDPSATEFSLRIVSVERLTSCEIRGLGGRSEPERKVFLKIRLHTSLAAAAGGEEGFMPLTPAAFFTAPSASSSEATPADSEAAFGCNDPTQVPVAVDAGGTEQGTLVLDAAHEHGLLIYEPPGTGGWSWRY